MCFPNDFDYFDFDYFDCPEKKISILSKKVNELFVDRPNHFVTLHRENQARFLQPLGEIFVTLKGNKKMSWKLKVESWKIRTKKTGEGDDKAGMEKLYPDRRGS